MSDLITLDYTLRLVTLGAALLGATSGALGAFAVLRGQSLLGDAISHAALPGVALTFLLFGTKAPLALLCGAAVTGWLAARAVARVSETSRVRYDSALATGLSVFFGLGLVLLTVIQKQPNAAQAGLDRFLFGQAAALLARDVWTMAAFALVALVLMLVFWKELKLLVFDAAFLEASGFSRYRMELLLMLLLVLSIVAGLQMVGVVLMSALVVAPGVAARQWTDRLGPMVALSALVGAVSGAGGALVSALTPGLPTGPAVVVVVTVLAVASLLFAPRRGVVARAIRLRRLRRDPTAHPVVR